MIRSRFSIFSSRRNRSYGVHIPRDVPRPCQTCSACLMNQEESSTRFSSCLSEPDSFDTNARPYKVSRPTTFINILVPNIFAWPPSVWRRGRRPSGFWCLLIRSTYAPVPIVISCASWGDRYRHLFKWRPQRWTSFNPLPPWSTESVNDPTVPTWNTILIRQVDWLSIYGFKRKSWKKLQHWQSVGTAKMTTYWHANEQHVISLSRHAVGWWQLRFVWTSADDSLENLNIFDST